MTKEISNIINAIKHDIDAMCKTNDYGTYGRCLLQDKSVNCLMWSRDTNCPLAESGGEE